MKLNHHLKDPFLSFLPPHVCTYQKSHMAKKQRNPPYCGSSKICKALEVYARGLGQTSLSSSANANDPNNISSCTILQMKPWSPWLRDYIGKRLIYWRSSGCFYVRRSVDEQLSHCRITSGCIKLPDTLNRY